MTKYVFQQAGRDKPWIDCADGRGRPAIYDTEKEARDEMERWIGTRENNERYRVVPR